jgi:hypothetical protein
MGLGGSFFEIDPRESGLKSVVLGLFLQIKAVFFDSKSDRGQLPAAAAGWDGTAHAGREGSGCCEDRRDARG